MHVATERSGSGPIARLRAVEITPAHFRKAAIAAALAIYVVVTTGAVVRLTASGLGCDNWPRCGTTPFPEKGGHAFIEFGNRVIALFTIVFTMVSWLVARRTPGLPRWVARLALVVFLGNVFQIPLGGITVIFNLNPLLVISHFLLAIAMLGAAAVVAVEAVRNQRGGAEPLVPLELRRIGLLLAAACLALVVTGTFATAAGPHSGGSDIPRLGTLSTAVYVHVRATGIFGIAFLFTAGYLTAHRARAPALFRAAFGLGLLLLAQVAIGEIQYHERLPWWLVLIHVSVAALIWAWTVVLVALLWRPPASLASRVDWEDERAADLEPAGAGAAGAGRRLPRLE